MEGGVSNITCLRVAVINYLPHVAVLSAGPDLEIGGTFSPILDILSQQLGFCYKYMVPSDRLYGKVFENGTSTGTIGAVLNGDADMTGLLVVDEARMKHLDFTVPLFMERFLAVVKRPVLEPDVAGFVKPFTTFVWTATLVAILFTSLTCTLLLGVYEALPLAETLSTPNDSSDGQPFMNLSLTSLLWCVAVLLCQGIAWVHRAASLRMLAGIWFIASLIISTVYRSNLKAMLIMPRIQLPFDNLEELYQSQYPLYVVETTVIHRAIMNAPGDSPLGRLKEQMVASKSETLMARKFYGGERVALAGVSISFRHFMNIAFSRFGFCFEYIMQDRLLDGLTQAVAFRKGSHLLPKMNAIILRLLEGGLMNHLVYRTMHNSSHCLGPIIQDLSSTKLRAQGLKDFYGVFSVFAGGIIIAILCFGFELVVGHGHNNRRDIKH
ncbi:uncharacterized protein LOC135094347 [Scylla paramamosain]|uniref:uncharacterized protein LOC135094347 n=1 Tax=Scylla paramamosain TaxID=85552 RepID=UPI0030830AB5